VTPCLSGQVLELGLFTSPPTPPPPMSQSLGLGVWHLIAMPGAGAASGSPAQVLLGLIKGLLSMTRNTAFATSNSTAKGVRHARGALLSLLYPEVRTLRVSQRMRLFSVGFL
jgi:hypothetical protein